MSSSNYIKNHYSILTYGLCVLLVIAIAVSAYVTFDKQIMDLTIGIIILLFSDVVLAIMTLVSMVAMFNEVSRLHAREFPKDSIDQMENLQKQCKALNTVFKQLDTRITGLEETCANLPNSTNMQTIIRTPRPLLSRIKSVMNWLKSLWPVRKNEELEERKTDNTEQNQLGTRELGGES